jgi:hypothetical protein
MTHAELSLTTYSGDGGVRTMTYSTEQNVEQVCVMPQLNSDMRRMLTVQFKEFIHHIEDHEVISLEERFRPVKNVTWISMYDKHKIA